MSTPATATTTDGEPLVYTARELAKLMKVDRSLAYKLVNAGVIPRLRGVGIGNREKVLIPAWALRSWIATGGDWQNEAFRPYTTTNGKAPAAVTAEA